MSLSQLLLGGAAVIELTDDNFEEELSKHDLILVEFFAPWCGHCKKLTPEYASAAIKLQSSSPPIPLAHIECTELGIRVCKELDIQGFPTLKIFRNGKFSADYDGSRSSAGIVSYMEKQATPGSVFIPSQDKLEEFIDHSEPSIVGFFKNDHSDSVMRESFVKCSNKIRMEFRFAHAYQTPSSLGQSDILPENVEGDQVWLYQPLRLRSKLDTSAIRVPEGTLDEVEKFIVQNFMGLVGTREPINSKYYDDVTRQPQLIFFCKLDWGVNFRTTLYWRNRLLKIAQDYRSKMNFAMSDSVTYTDELSNKYGIIQTSNIQAVIMSNSLKYVMPQETDSKISPENIRQFVEDYLAGEIQAYLKSEMKPIDNDEPVKLVVGRTFDEIVLDDDKDVLIELYAPWCGHCQTLAPKLVKLAEKLESNTNIVIAKMDATANDFPESFIVEGFPTIYWVPAGVKDKPVEYDGGREVKDFMRFIKKHATIPFKLTGSVKTEF